MQKLEYPALGETLYRDTLPNGLRLSVAVKPGYSRSFACFATNYGGADRRFRLGNEFIDTPMGVAHFLEHKMFDMPDGDNALACLAANGAQPNAYTGSGITAYHFESTANFDENLRMLLKFVSTPYFTKESVAKEQGIIGQEIRMCEDNPDYVLFDEMTRCLFQHHPIRDSVAGTQASIAQITPEMLYNCHKIFYNPGNMALSVAGDVDPEAVRAAAMELLPAEAGEVPGRDYGPPESEYPEKTRFLRAMEVSAPQFMIGSRLLRAQTGPALLRQKLVCAMTMACLYSQSSPFFSRLYSAGLLNADFAADAEHAAGTFTLVLGGESRDPEAVFEAVCAEAEQVMNKGLDAAYFERIRRVGYGTQIRALSSFSSMCSQLTAADFENYNYLDTFSLLNSITAQEIRDFIHSCLRRECLAMSVIVPADKTGGNTNA